MTNILPISFIFADAGPNTPINETASEREAGLQFHMNNLSRKGTNRVQ